MLGHFADQSAVRRPWMILKLLFLNARDSRMQSQRHYLTYLAQSTRPTSDFLLAIFCGAITFAAMTVWKKNSVFNRADENELSRLDIFLVRVVLPFVWRSRISLSIDRFKHRFVQTTTFVAEEGGKNYPYSPFSSIDSLRRMPSPYICGRVTTRLKVHVRHPIVNLAEKAIDHRSFAQVKTAALNAKRFIRGVYNLSLNSQIFHLPVHSQTACESEGASSFGSLGAAETRHH